MIVITIINSISVNPKRRAPRRRRRFAFFSSGTFNPHIFAHHQSEYFVPSCATPCDFEYTSNTFFPPQLVESGSSCTARNPHSFCPVMGSTGILRRKRIFLSLEAPSCTPFTSVSKSGGYPSLPSSTLIWL